MTIPDIIRTIDIEVRKMSPETKRQFLYKLQWVVDQYLLNTMEPIRIDNND